MADSLGRINQKTHFVGLIGHPVGQSVSPAMHNAAFSKLKLDYVYMAFDVVDLRSALHFLKKPNCRGFNVTIPYKEDIVKYIDALDEKARLIGAVNTVVNSAGTLKGYNTDWYGVFKSLEKLKLRDKRAAVIGAGGTARAIVFALKKAGIGNITIFNRTLDKAQIVAECFGCDYSKLGEIENYDFDILLNATPVGMHPKITESPVPKEVLRNIVVFDAIYNPQETKLLRDARNNRCKTINGVDMLVWQGARAFELWTGKKAPVDLMRKTVSQKLK